MKLAGIDVRELKRLTNEKKKDFKTRSQEDNKRKRWIINRVKQLLPYQDALCPGSNNPNGYCPNCGMKRYEEEAWGIFSVFVYKYCTNCKWEFGHKYPKPPLMGRY